MHFWFGKTLFVERSFDDRNHQYLVYQVTNNLNRTNKHKFKKKKGKVEKKRNQDKFDNYITIYNIMSHEIIHSVVNVLLLLLIFSDTFR
jgi:hypothetical protein